MAGGEERLAVVGARLKQARRFNGYSAAHVASHLGIARSSLSLYEAGKRDIRLTLFMAMVDLYRVDARWLLGYTDEFSVTSAPQRRVAYLYEYDE